MTPADRTKHVRAIFDKFVIPILDAKGHDYAGETDVNCNFKIVADRMKSSVDKYDVWQVFFEKHMTAIETWLKDRSLKSEPIHMRIVDAINYLLILWAMASEDGLMPKPTENGVNK